MEPSFPSLALPEELGQRLLEAARSAHGQHPGDPMPAADRPPDAAERLLGLAMIWAEARFGFAYWDLRPDLDWNAVFLRYAPRVMAAADEAEHWRLLREVVRLLGDGHTDLVPPERVRAGGSAEPGLRLEAVEGAPTITQATQEAMEAGFRPGVRITSVDGVPAARAVEAAAAAISASTEHYRTWAATRKLLSGAHGTDAHLEGRYPDGRPVEGRLVRRSGAAYPWQRITPVVSREVSPGILHIELNTFGWDGVPGRLRELVPDFVGVRALILDLRRNSGGNSGIGYAVLQRLLAAPAATSAFRLRAYVPTFRAWGWPQFWLQVPGELLSPDGDGTGFGGPAVVLVGPETASAAEDFLVAWKSAARGPLVGGATCGSTGQPLPITLPGGGRLRVCSKRDTYPDGTPFVGTGILPDIPAARTWRGVAAGRDEVLEAALTAIP